MKKRKGAEEPSIIHRLAALADKHGMWARDLLQYPEILQEDNIQLKDINHSIAMGADQYNQEQMRALLRRVEDRNERLTVANHSPIPQKTVPVEKERKPMKLKRVVAVSLCEQAGEKKAAAWTDQQLADSLVGLVNRSDLDEIEFSDQNAIICSDLLSAVESGEEVIVVSKKGEESVAKAPGKKKKTTKAAVVEEEEEDEDEEEFDDDELEEEEYDEDEDDESEDSSELEDEDESEEAVKVTPKKKTPVKKTPAAKPAKKKAVAKAAPVKAAKKKAVKEEPAAKPAKKKTPTKKVAETKTAKKRGLSNKDRVYKKWATMKDQSASGPNVEKLMTLVDGAVKDTTIRNWISSWNRGLALPRVAMEE
jgi:antitoxin (DNA-binding transcriptional repressor) of toxin-antitoxin stability system